MIRTLRKGLRGPDVLRWQRFLGEQGFDVGPLDAVFSDQVVNATRAFQDRFGLDVDGKVGPITFGKAGEMGLRFLRRVNNAELNQVLIAEARKILKAHHADPFGTEVPFSIDGISYVGRIEEHFHPPGGKLRPWGPHPGVSLFVETGGDSEIVVPDEHDAPSDVSEPTPSPVADSGVIVIDPGHGGSIRVGGSSPNNAISPSGVLEKSMTLDMALLVKDALEERQPSVRVELTRATDVNLGLDARARRARDEKADLFLSIHFNGANGNARGVETHIRPKSGGNVNFAADQGFADRVCRAVHGAIAEFDPETRLRGVKESNLGVLRDEFLGNSAALSPTKACLLEVEFLDVPGVDVLFNTGPQRDQVRRRVAGAIAVAMIQELEA